MSTPVIGIIGLGYVGLPLARLFATKYSVVGYDIKEQRVAELRKGEDHTQEVANELLKEVLVDAIDTDISMPATSEKVFNVLKKNKKNKEAA